MTAGINCRTSIWRWTYDEDDSVGGAEPTGTFVYRDIGTFLQEQPVEQLLLQQGMETPRIFNATIYPGWLTIYERDEVEVITPTDFAYYGDRFRVIHARPSSHNRRDPRSYMMLTLTRSERAHEHQ